MIGGVIAAALIAVIVGSVVAATGIGNLKLFYQGTGTVESRLQKVEDYLVDNSKAVKTELYRMQREIDALEVTPTPTATPTSASAFTVTGSGTDTREVTLTSGVWTLAMQISGNTECLFGTCIPSAFVVTMESVSGSWVELATSQLTADWNGQVVLRVGSGLVSLTPGRQIVSVTAAAASEWTLTFQSSGGTPTPTPRSTAPAAPPTTSRTLTPTATPTASAETDFRWNCGDEEAIDVVWRVTEKNSVWWKFSYQVSLVNRGSQSYTDRYYEVGFYDADGFKLDDGNGHFSIAANGGTTTISDSTLISGDLAPQVACAKFDI